MIWEVFRQERKGQPFVAWRLVPRARPGVRGRVRARVLRAAAGVGRALGRAARGDHGDRGVPGRVRPQVPPRGRLLDQGEAEGGAACRRRWSAPSAARGLTLLLELADDELILGWRNSEWTGIAPFLEEDVAFSSIAQNEIGHARALYDLAAAELGTDADALAFDRKPEEYRCAPLVQLRLVPDWARTIARHVLYETADAIRIERLKEHEDAELAGIAAKIEREEVYHRLHAEMWLERLRGEERYATAVDELWPYALGVLDAGAAAGCSRSASAASRRSRRSSARRRAPSSPSSGTR